MLRSTILAAVSIALASVACNSGHTQAPETPSETPTEQVPQQATDDSRLGNVHFTTSCDEEVQEEFRRGLARLHHMWYVKARESFANVAERDPSCAMAQWGIAMTYYTPLWAPPEREEFEAGRKAAEAAQKLSAETQREKDFIAAVAAFYEGDDDKSLDARARAFRDGWEQAHKRNPDDIEAASFHALAILATAPSDDPNYRAQKRAGTILEDVLEEEPLHPAGHHYLIHAYDHPQLAEDALEVARNYADIAPAVPHALHMPSHIFVRLGLWNDVIDWNQRSAKVAFDNPVDGRVSLHYFHALDYLAYGYLQQAKDQKAKQVVEKLATENPPQPHPASAYASAAIPARHALERRDWKAAAEVQPGHADALPWNKMPFMAAISHATRAIGAAKTGDTSSAREELKRLNKLHEQTSEMDQPYWLTQVEVYRSVARATLAEANGDIEDAISTLRKAAQKQNARDKHPISPGRVIDADDFLGWTLCEQGQHADALEVYERALDRSPRRFRPLYGAAVSARRGGETETARKYYQKLVDMTADADTERPEIIEAKEFLASEPSPET